MYITHYSKTSYEQQTMNLKEPGPLMRYHEQMVHEHSKQPTLNLDKKWEVCTIHEKKMS
jgi:hypothetical protein